MASEFVDDFKVPTVNNSCFVKSKDIPCPETHDQLITCQGSCCSCPLWGVNLMMFLTKLKYFTNLDFREIRGFPFLSYLLGFCSFEVAMIWTNVLFAGNICLLLMEEILHQLRLVVDPTIYKVLYYTSQVVQEFVHQQYVYISNMTPKPWFFWKSLLNTQTIQWRNAP